MRQLALDIRLAEHAVFDSYYAGPNSLAVARLRRLAVGEERGVCWLAGGEGTGKSHLLQACVALAHAAGELTAYLPLARLAARGPPVLDGLGGFDLVALDDVGSIAGRRDWELALLHTYEQVATRGARLVAADEVAPALLGFALADLSSRLAVGGVFRLESLGESECRLALQQRARWLGVTLPGETVDYLLKRVDRHPARLFTLLNRLDRAALAAQKRLTVPFVRSVIDGPEG